MAAYLNASADVPAEIREALQDAMETAIANVPAIAGKVWFCPDVSGSMQSPVTGHRPGATTAVRCIDVAALMTAGFLRKNRGRRSCPFRERLVRWSAQPARLGHDQRGQPGGIAAGRDQLLGAAGGAERRKAKGDLVIFVSDNESWAGRKTVAAPR